MEAHRMVIPFIKEELPEKKLEQFLKHIEQCSDCMDELDICFTMYQAMDLLEKEDKPDYDFKRMLADSIHAARRRLFFSRVFRIGRIALIALADLLLVFCILTAAAIRQGKAAEPVFGRIWTSIYSPAVPAETETAH